VLDSIAVPFAGTNPLEVAALHAAAQQARVSSDSGIVTEDGWKTVDKVLHPTRLEYYSSKPPLLSALAAGEYWLLKKTFGWSITDDRGSVVRTILVTFNVVPLVVYLLLLGRLADLFGATDWGRLFVVTAAAFGTLLTPFLNTFNNHTVATCAAVVALYAAVRVLLRAGEGPPGWGWFALAGFFAGLTACNETPAAAFAAGLFLVLALRHPARAVAAFLPAALLPALALLYLNYLELGTFELAYSQFGGPWYDYEGSHWKLINAGLKRGIDAAHFRETKAAYAFHLLLGHHGWFSLTPINFLGLAGMIVGVALLLRRRPGDEAPARALWAELTAATLALSVVVIGFYVRKTGNYGGNSAGPRWLAWLAPSWLLSMLPVLDWLGTRRWGRALALALLAVSVLSASYPAWGPWRQPWVYNWMDARGWVPY
jgi:MFS family permease